MSKHRVLLVEDQTAIRQLLARLLATMGDFVVVGQTHTAAEAVALLDATTPDIVILDWTLAGGCGKEVLAAARRQAFPPSVLVFSGSVSAPIIREALAAGAKGFLEKTASVDELTAALYATAAGCQYLGEAAAALVRGPEASGHWTDDFLPLSPREEEVLRHVADGLPSKQIAAEIGVSTRTVENHRANISRKTGLNSVAQLTRHALQLGLV